jgi:aspartate aminotransferase
LGAGRDGKEAAAAGSVRDSLERHAPVKLIFPIPDDYRKAMAGGSADLPADVRRIRFPCCRIIELRPMFQSLPAVAPDPVFSLLDEFRADANPEKINLTVGAWQNDQGLTPVMHCVKVAEEQILEKEATKNYLGIAGMKEFNEATARLLYGDDSTALQQARVCCIQTPGGTGALRIVAGFLERIRPQSRLWIGQPTWANHVNIFSQANVQLQYYDYLDAGRTGLNFESLVTALAEAAEGDAFLFHTCCHNPSGFDLAVDQWEIVFGFVRERNLLAVFDCAYQGLRESVEADVWPIRRLSELDTEFMVCSSNSKNFGLYGERVGAVSAVCKSVADAELLGDNLGSMIRAMYSNPPKHGAAIVTTILGDPDLRNAWECELVEVRQRIERMRKLLLGELDRACGTGHFDFMKHQFGMFSFTGLSPAQVDRLRTEFSIYMLRSGRINVAGVCKENVTRLSESIATVIA